jgi:type I restriction enzyme R subunit
LTLVQLIVERGEHALEALPKGLRENREAMAETIENNVRRLIIDEMAVNPKYYEKMSQLLDALIAQRRHEALDYKAYLARIVALTKQVSQPEATSSYPPRIDSGALRAFYDNLEEPRAAVVRERLAPPYGDRPEPNADGRERLALALDGAIRAVKKADWRGNRFKEREIRNAIRSELGDDEALLDAMFEIVTAQRDY